MRLRGERALVTGATAGIGRAIAQRFAAEGAAVVVAGRDVARAQAVVDAITTAGGTSTLLLADLRDETECRRLVDRTVEVLGGIDVLVNNAAIGSVDDGPAGTLPTDAWEAVLRINLTAPMWLCRAALAHMVPAEHGAIVNISSRQGHRPGRGLTAYATSKGGLDALTRSLAVDYARHGIRVNAISPGYVLNERRDASLDPERRARLEGMHLTRLGAAEDVAHAAVYLASAEAGFVTGVNLELDGGSSIARGTSLG